MADPKNNGKKNDAKANNTKKPNDAKNAGKSNNDKKPTNNAKKNDSKPFGNASKSNNDKKNANTNKGENGLDPRIDDRKYSVVVNPEKKTRVDEHRRTLSVIKRVLREGFGDLFVDHMGIGVEVSYDVPTDRYNVHLAYRDHAHIGYVENPSPATYIAVAITPRGVQQLGACGALSDCARAIIRAWVNSGAGV